MMPLLHRVSCVAAFCAVAAVEAVRADDWPQFRGPNRDAVWSEAGILQTFPAEGLAIRWRAPVGKGHSSPVVCGGRVYISDSLVENATKAWDRVHCFDEVTGKLLWTRAEDMKATQPINPQNPPSPVATPVVDTGLVFAATLEAQLWCLDAATGAMVWSKDLVADYQLSAQPNFSACPLVEGDKLIVAVCGKPGACVVAFDKRTGRELWRALDDPERAFSSPIVVTAGGRRQLIVWTPTAITSLNPDDGKTWWRHELATRQDYAVASPVLNGDLLLISGLMFRLDRDKPAATVLWPQDTKSVAGRVLSHTSMPAIHEGHVFAGKMGGRLVCLEAGTGKQLWETDKPTKLAHCATIHLTLQGGSFLLFTDQGNLIRARLTPAGYEELSRAQLIEPTYLFAGRKLVWAVPAFANRHVFARSETEVVCASLEDKKAAPAAR